MLSKLALFSACISCFGIVLATTAKSQAEPVSTSRWSGTYIGLTAGYGGFGVNVDDGDLAPLAPYTEGERNAPDGFLGGVVLGHDFQNGHWVYGVEGDFSLSTVSGYADSDYGTGPARTDVDLDWLATFRGRVGRLLNDDLLLYGTAGLAIAHATETEATSMKTYVNKNTHFGVAAGAGAEWMLSNGVSLRAEALYVHLSEETYGTDLPVDADADGVIGRIGVGIRF